MLKKLLNKPAQKTKSRVAIVASRYNRRYVDSMVRAAEKTLKNAGARVDTLRVPGAFEIPSVAARLAAGESHDVLICLGVIIRGATFHAQQIGDAVAHALAGLQVRHHLPVIHEVLLLENEIQAKERCLDPRHNRGIEAAQTALEMAALMRRLDR